jgi:hypothetical protein
MEVVCFKRHEDNPLDTLGIGRVDERKKEKFYNFIDKTIADVTTLFSKYKGVKLQEWEKLYDIEEPAFKGFIIKFKIINFIFSPGNQFDFYNWDLKIRMDPERAELSSASLRSDHFVFGSIEECLESLETWLEDLQKNQKLNLNKI